MDLARPVALHRRRAHDKVWSARRDVSQRDDRLAGLAETHVVGEDGALPPEQERDAFDLMREEPLRQPGGAAKGRVDVVRREREQLGEGVRLSVEGFIHGAVSAALSSTRIRPSAQGIG